MRSKDRVKPARISSSASPKAARMVATTSTSTNRSVTRSTVQNTGSSVKAVT